MHRAPSRRPVPQASGGQALTSFRAGTTRWRAGRVNDRDCLTPVQAFYLYLAPLGSGGPERWATWGPPCPIGQKEINGKKAERKLKSRMNARSR